ncbi:protein PAXX isoform X1 [Carcharodon carcharias]|uniref:protein PAXX isoform X1 n=1 Tax=Carcharodon carcharias TaxID=13397 RepID=UPI001B7F44D4|nr:protein PAXX isoform X1 [Carcharodon carcharias]XP_041048871.1 protein PAXX isoform X1 [Carcharodon carcharias]XP_041048873.1 protein PAXX isoform X1 [Carcharodon carcharias]XP_041048874.1 protein PAXX isoform X1 [Carcharodon carcharias]
MEAVQQVPSIGSLHIHTLAQNHQRYLCYTRPGPQSFNLCVTNVVDVWSTGFSPQKLEEHKSTHGVKTAEDYHSRTRDAFQKATVSITVLDNIILLKLSQDDLGLTFDLYKLPMSEAKMEIQSVMFHLVDQVHHLEKQLKASEESNALNLEKTMQRTQRMFLSDYESMRKGNGPESSPVAKKRPAGESLINPGSKRTKAPIGVSFEDNSLDESSE